jgi:Nucleotidyltransferase domain
LIRGDAVAACRFSALSDTVCSVSSEVVAVVGKLAGRHGIETGQLVASLARGEDALEALRAGLRARFPLERVPGLDVVVIGSIAKGTCTAGSDVDFFGVYEGGLPGESDAIMRAVLDEAAGLGFGKPYAGGPCGTSVARSDIEAVAIRDDVLRVFTQMNLANASVSIYRPEIRARALRNLVSTFVGRDRKPRVRGIVDHMVRLRRWGNIIAELRLDDHASEDGGLVNWSKSVTLYRVEFAGTLAAMLRAEIASEGRSREDLLDEVILRLDRVPLLRLLEWYDDVSPAGRESLATVVSVLDESLRLFGGDGVRSLLVAGADDEGTRWLRRRIEEQASRLYSALVQIFYQEPAFRRFTEELGLLA